LGRGVNFVLPFLFLTNSEAYQNGSALFNSEISEGRYLLVHCSSNDNIYFQNSVGKVNALVDNNIHFQTMCYLNRTHRI